MIAETYGWDTVFAIGIADLNAAIVAQSSSPKTFAASGVDPLARVSFSVSGKFGDWSVTPGGSGTLIHLLVPIPSLTVASAGGTSVFSNGQAIVEVELSYLAQVQSTVETSGTLYDLRVRTSAEADDQPVAIIDITFSEANFADLAADVTSVMSSWFNANISDFDHVFATVNLGRTADTGLFAWLLPTSVEYAYIDGGPSGGMLGVLAMTQGRDASTLSAELSPNAIPSGSRAGFLISARRLLEMIILPSMPSVFPGSTVADYALDPDGNGISLSNPVVLDPVQYNGSSYTPTLQSLEITLSNGSLTLEAVTKTEVSWQIWSYCRTTTTYQISLVPQTRGTQTLTFQESGNVPPEHWTEQGEGIEITEIIAEIVASVLILVIGVLTGGAGLVIATLVIGLLSAIVSVTPAIIAAIGTNDAPPVTALVTSATSSIQWTDQKDFILTSAELNGSLQLGGTVADRMT